MQTTIKLKQFQAIDLSISFKATKLGYKTGIYICLSIESGKLNIKIRYTTTYIENGTTLMQRRRGLSLLVATMK